MILCQFRVADVAQLGFPAHFFQHGFEPAQQSAGPLVAYRATLTAKKDLEFAIQNDECRRTILALAAEHIADVQDAAHHGGTVELQELVGDA